MASSKHTVELNTTEHQVWNFVSDMNNWAPLMPGYISHEVINENEGIWEFLGDFGFIKKKITLKVDKIVRVAPTIITFDLKGLNENVEGDGKFELEILSENLIRLNGCLDISGGGFMGAMINNVLKTFVPESTAVLVTSIEEKLGNGNEVSS